MADEGEGSQLILWARNESNRLTNLGTSNWIASGEVSAAVEFLRKFAGPQSAFAQHAEESYSREVGHMAARSVVAGLLRWADFKEHGLAQELPIEVRIRIEAANDLMEQVQRLLDDRDFHQAAPVVLAGAALEELLRSMVDANGLAIPGTPGIKTYADTLRAADVITKQEAKDITSWAGYRNDAAHGNFADVYRDVATLMAAGVNLFMQRRTPGSAATP